MVVVTVMPLERESDLPRRPVSYYNKRYFWALSERSQQADALAAGNEFTSSSCTFLFAGKLLLFLAAGMNVLVISICNQGPGTFCCPGLQENPGRNVTRI